MTKLRQLIVIAAWMWLLASATFSHAAMIREGDEFWVINSRSLSGCLQTADLQNPNLNVYRYCGETVMETANVQSLYDAVSSDPSYLNVLYVHGNRFTAQEAIDRALNVYRRVSAHRHDPTKIRWILWSWPSEPILNPLKDVRVKAARADIETLYAGWFLQSFPALDRLEMIGYSFGGRVVTGALHTAAGGTMGGRSLSGSPIKSNRISLTLFAPALDRHWLANGSKHGLAVENMGALNLFYNSRDRVLALYSMVSQYYDPVALGYAGLGPLGLRSDGTKVHVHTRDCGDCVGRLHDELRYFDSCCKADVTIAQSIDIACRRCAH